MGNGINTKLGGGVATAVGLRGVNTTTDMSGANREISSLASGINDLIGTLVKVKVANDIQRNEEDKMRATERAELEHYDVNNALSGGSYDNTLNEQVSQWRADGLMDSEIRTKIKDYKFNKTVQDSGLGQEGGRSADDADMAFFNTFTKLEMKAITPMLQADRQVVQNKISNMTSSYISNSDDSLQDKFNNTVTTNKSYGMTEEDAMVNLMSTAFNKARRGDETLLRQLQDVTDSTGVKLIDTVKGAEIYNKLNDNLLQKKEHDLNVARKEADFQQEVTANKLYSSMIDSKDIHSFKLNVDSALSSGKISMQQHHTLSTYYKTITSESNFPKQSDPKAYVTAYSQAEQGLLTQYGLMTLQGKLSSTDFELVARTAIQKGGINGLGYDESKALQERIKDDANSFGGSSGINDLTLELHSKQIFPMRTGYIQQNLKVDVDKFIATNKKLPNEEEYAKLRDKVVSNAERLYNERTVKPIDIKVPTEKAGDSITGRDKLLSDLKSLKSKEEVDRYINGLTPMQKKLLKGE